MDQVAQAPLEVKTTKVNKMAKLVGGAGGGGSSGGSEASDNLKSSALLSIVDLLGEGQIGGLVDNSPSSVFLNDTPLASKSGSYNFEDVTWGIVTGTQDQDALGDGFNAVESVTSLNLKVTNASPAIFTVNDPNAGSVRVIVSTPGLTYTNSKGDISGSSVAYKFEVSVNGGQFYQVGLGQISGKTRSRYQRAYVKELPKTAPNGEVAKSWTIRVTRTTPDSSNSRTSNDLYVDSYSTIIDTRLTYPNTAVFGLQVNAEQFTTEPQRSYLLDGLLIRVPSNRDKVSRTYNGVWDGTFKLEVCDNPAWILYDIITNERYGLGQYVPELYANAARLYEIGRYCDEMIDDGFGQGNLEPRFTINTTISSLADAFQLISDITSVFNGMAFWTGNTIGYMADMPTPVSMIYSPSNVIDGEFIYQGSSRKDRHSVVLVRYNDPDRNYETQTEYVEDSELVERFGVRKAEIAAFGCTTRGQAYRVGKWLLYTEKYQSAVVTFKVGIDSALVLPGDVIQIVDPHRSGKRHGGRLVACTAKSATLDDQVTIETGSTISLRTEKGDVVERLISSSKVVTATDGRALTQVLWATALVNLPVKNSVWQISSPSVEPLSARVVSVGQGDNPGEFSISAIEHNPSKFDYIEKDMLLETTKVTTIDPKAVVEPTSKVTLFSEKFIEQDTTRYSLSIAWEQVTGAVSYLVKYRKESGNWIELPAQTGLSVDVENIYAGNYEASVQAISPLNSKSQVTYSELTSIEGSASVLPKLTSFAGDSLAWAIGLNWTFSSVSSGVKYTEIQQSLNYNPFEPGTETWTSVANVPFPAKEYTIAGLTTLDFRYFRARIVDGFNNYGEWSDVVLAYPTSDIDSIKTIIEGQVGIEALDSALSGKVNTTSADATKALADAKAAADAAIKEVADRKAAIAAETKARTNSIKAQADALAKEVTDRTTAIAAEATGRDAAIAAAAAKEATDRANAIAAEASARNTAITTAVSKEATDRAAAITAEATARTTALNKEVTDRKAAITKEVTDRNAAITAKANEINADVAAKVKTLNDGITQEVTDRKAGDTEVVGQLNAYKASNDQAVAAVLEKAETAISNDAATASKVTGLQSSLDTTNSNVAKKADATALTALETKVTNSEDAIKANTTSVDKITSSLGGAIEGLKITGTTTAISEIVVAPNRKSKVTLVADDQTTTGNVIRFGQNDPDSLVTDGISWQGATQIQVDPSKLYRVRYRVRRVVGDAPLYLGIQQINADKSAILSSLDAEQSLLSTTGLYLLSAGRPPIGEWLEGEFFYKGKTTTDRVTGNGTLASPRTFTKKTAFFRLMGLMNYAGTLGQQDIDYFIVEDYTDAALGNANSESIVATNTEVSRINGVVTTHSTSIAKLQSDLSATDTKAGTAVTNAATAQQTANTAVTAAGANASRITELDSSFKSYQTANDAALAQTNANVSTVEKTSADADKALGIRIDTVVATAKTDKADLTSLVSTETTARTNADSALGQRIDTLSASTTTELGKTNAAVKAEETARTSADTALGQRIDTLTASTDTELGKTNAAVTAEQTARTTADTALGKRIDAVVATAKTDKTNLQSAITSEQTARTSADTALGSRIDTLTTTVSNNDTAVKGQIQDVAKSVTTLEGSTNTKFSSLESQLSNTNKELGTVKTAATKAQSTADTAVSNAAAVANRTSTLEGKMTAVEGDVAKKLDATAINNYYTKAQSDASATTIAAGEVSKYDAKLTIGGSNLYFGPNPVVLRSQTSAGRIVFAETASGNTQRFNYLTNDNLDLSGLQIGDPTIASIEIFVPSTDTSDYTIQFGTYRFSATGYIYAPTVDVKTLPKDTWVKLTTAPGTYTSGQPATGINLVFNLVGRKTAGDEIQWRNFMMEKATTASSFVESDKATQAKLDANSTAIDATNTEVNRVNGEVVAQGNKISTLESSLSAVDAKAGTAVNNAATAQQTANTGVTKADAVAGRTSTLESKMSKVEGEVAKKLNATAINDYYTKTETDSKATTIAAGEVNKYDAQLVIGGTNLIDIAEVQKLAVSSTIVSASNYRGFSLPVKTGEVYSISRPAIESNRFRYVFTEVAPENGVAFFGGTGNATTYDNALKIENIVVPAGAQYLFVYMSNQGETITKLKVERGSKASDWSESPVAVENKLNANAQAINTTNTEVTRIDGVTKTQASSLNKLQSDLAVTDAKAGTALSNAAAAQTTANSAVTANAAVASRTSTLEGKMSTVENGLAKKADATALNNYYTKSQTEGKATEIAAGEVGKFKAGLKIGGRNLCSLDEYFLLGGSDTSSTIARRLGEVEVISQDSATPNFYTWIGNYTQASALDVGTEIIASYEVMIPEDVDMTKAGDNFEISMGLVYNLMEKSMYSTRLKAKDLPQGIWIKVVTAPDKVKNPAGNALAVGRFYNPFVGFKLKYRRLMLEAANAASDWVPSELKAQAAIDANAEAINATDAKVQQVDGVVQSHTTSLNKLTSNLATTDTKAGTALSNAATAQTTANTGVTKADAVAARTSTLESKMATVEGNVAKKADATTLNSYYTKTEADSATAGKIEQFKSSMVIGGVNQLLNSEAERSSTASTRREYLMYENSNHLYKFFEENLGKDVTISFDLKVDIAGLVQVYCSNGTHHTYSSAVRVETADVGKWVRYSVTVRPAKHGTAANAAYTTSAVEFYGIYDTGRIPYVRKVQLEAGSFATDWSVSPRDLQNAINVNATAISNTYTKAETNKAITTATSSLKSQVDKNLAEQNSTITTWVDRNKVEAAMMETLAAELVPHMAGNTDLFADMEIKVGYQGVITALADTDAATMMRVDTLEANFDNANAQIQATQRAVADLEHSTAQDLLELQANFKTTVNDTLTPAVADLNAKLKNEYLTIADSKTAISSATTTLKSEVTKGYTDAIKVVDDAVKNIKLDSITIPDTRSANQLPTWYRTNYKSRMVNEFKTATVIGLTTALAGQTYVMLTTYVYYGDSSGGPIKQVATGKTDDQTYIRYSTGSGSSEVWGAWVKQGAAMQTTITEQSQTIDGIKGIKTVTIDNNGVMSGYGLVSELVGGQVTSAFGVNADQFYVGSPKTGKKVFAVVNGQTVINDAVIGNLSASKITTGTMHGDRITAGTLTADKLSAVAIDAIALKAQNIVVYKDKTKPKGVRLELVGGLLSVYDDANTLRVRLGFWS